MCPFHPERSEGLPLNDNMEAPEAAHVPLPFALGAGRTAVDALHITGLQHMASMFGESRKELGKALPSFVETPGGTGMMHPASSDGTTETKKQKTKKHKDTVSSDALRSKPITSLMLCNIPCCISQEQLAGIINHGGFHNRYDYLYLPMPTHGGSSHNLGYGFINLLTPEDAELCIQCFQGHNFEGTSSQKTLQVKPAHIQGLVNNIRNFRRAHQKDRRCRGIPLTLNEQLLF
eukprot:CAMPEP_0195103628 /NCGR_PEP_ID=MMETSP0448-20130528/72626_1 /TAXON_ID=66468 /ORGANISM="Heterocapsa triquestra, Strain CCMP 448" /LENGTH=232 /DNA_ID=CAMNT_0040139351 /DNA_START=32 /DNA_END=730 /DNA_ORIENTATION=-